MTYYVKLLYSHVCVLCMKLIYVLSFRFVAEDTATLFRNVAKQCERFAAYSSHNHLCDIVITSETDCVIDRGSDDNR